MWTGSLGVETTLGLKRKLIMDRWLQEWTNEVMKMMDLRDCAKGSTENEEIAENEDDRGDHQSNGRR